MVRFISIHDAAEDDDIGVTKTDIRVLADEKVFGRVSLLPVVDVTKKGNSQLAKTFCQADDLVLVACAVGRTMGIAQEINDFHPPIGFLQRIIDLPQLKGAACPALG